MDPVEPIVTPAPPLPTETHAPRTVAPLWHTIVLVVFVLAMSATSAPRIGEMVSKHGRMQMYLTTIFFEWLMVLYVWWGMRKTGTHLREVIGGKWNAFEDALLDVALAFGVWIGVALALAGLGYLMGLTKNVNVEEAKKSILVMLPQTGPEMLAWAGLSATAGFCEEIIFRGYFLRQFSGWFGAMWLGVAAQALLFGLSHGYEGWQRMVLIALEGVILAAIALWRRSLRPVMGAHFLQDFISGMLGRVAMKAMK